MGDLADRIRSAAVVREIDLGECDPVYAGIRVPFRVNWSRRQHRERYELSIQHAQLDKRAKAGEDLSGEFSDNLAAWLRWWGDVLMATPQQVRELFDALSDPHWAWLTGRILEDQAAYEEEETKKVRGRPGAGCGEPPAESPNPTTAP